jgi:quinoprotein dehydrogenase-associated probable ABC transporter substrate-binding protein
MSAVASDARVLRVCADPNNLPFSNRAQQGFENRIADLIARDLNAKLEYVWWSQRKSFLRNSLEQGACDLVIGVPSAMDSLLTTRPYYLSTYVFVSRADRQMKIVSLYDDRFANWRVGVHITDDNYAPPAAILADRGFTANLVGYSLFGKFGEPNPPSRLIEAVRGGEVDVALAWGPIAGYFAKAGDTPLDITPVSPPTFRGVPFTYAISAGVRKSERSLRDEIDSVIGRECVAIQAILTSHGIPRLKEDELPCASARPPSSSLR